MNVGALSAQTQANFVARFAELFQAIDCHLQLQVRVRPYRNGPVGADKLLHATGQHIADMAEKRHAYSQEIFVVVSSLGASEKLGHDFNQVFSLLRALGLEPRELNEPERETFSIESSLGLEKPGFVRVGDELARGVALRTFPGQTVDPGWLGPLFNLRTACDIAVHVTPLERWNAVSKLNRKLRDLTSDRLLAVESERIGDARTESGLESAYFLRDRLARNQARPLDLSVTALVYGRTPDMLNDAAREVMTAFKAAGAVAEITHFRHRAAALSVAALGEDVLQMGKLVDSVSAATCLPWTANFIDDIDGYLLGRDISSDLPVKVSPFTGGYANANVLVFAASGQGKSYALGNLVIEGLAHGVESVVIDPEGEYRGLIESLEGSYLQLAPGSGCAINIFDLADASEEATTSTVIDLIAALAGKLSSPDRAQIDLAVKETIAVGAPSLRELIPRLLGPCPEIAAVLGRFCSGEIGELFCGRTSVNLDRPLLGIGLRELPRDFVGAATTVVSHWLWHSIRFQRRRRHLVFDEAGLLSQHEHLRAFMVELARRCRKYNASLVIATQNATDLLRSDDGRVVATNPALVMLGGHRESELHATAEAFGLTGAEESFLSTASRGDFLLLAGQRRVKLHVDVSPVHHALITGSALSLNQSERK